MTKEEKIEILEKFRDELQLLRDGDERTDTRKNIGQMSAVVSKIMSQAKTLKQVRITKPTKNIFTRLQGCRIPIFSSITRTRRITD